MSIADGEHQLEGGREGFAQVVDHRAIGVERGTEVPAADALT